MRIRSRQDRRQRKVNADFPLHDCLGREIHAERRKLADRRLGNIETEWLEIQRESGHSTLL